MLEKSFGEEQAMEESHQRSEYTWSEIGRSFREGNLRVILTLLGVSAFILVVAVKVFLVFVYI